MWCCKGVRAKIRESICWQNFTCRCPPVYIYISSRTTLLLRMLGRAVDGEHALALPINSIKMKTEAAAWLLRLIWHLGRWDTHHIHDLGLCGGRGSLIYDPILLLLQDQDPLPIALPLDLILSFFLFQVLSYSDFEILNDVGVWPGLMGPICFVTLDFVTTPTCIWLLFCHGWAILSF